MKPVLLDVKHLVKWFPVTAGLMRRVVAQVKAVNGIDFTIHEGEVLGMVGESGVWKKHSGTCSHPPDRTDIR